MRRLIIENLQMLTRRLQVAGYLPDDCVAGCRLQVAYQSIALQLVYTFNTMNKRKLNLETSTCNLQPATNYTLDFTILRFLTFIPFLLLANNLSAQVKINVSLDQTAIVIGDQFSASVRISAPKGSNFLAVNYTVWEEAGVELLDIKPILTTSQEPQLLMEQQLKLTSFDTGYHRLPSLEVIYELNGITDTAFSNALNLNVTGLQVQEDAPIRDNKDIIKEERNWRDIVPYGAAIFITLLIIGIIWKLANKQPKIEEKAPPLPVPAHEIAFEKLALLKTEELWKKGEIKAFQSQLTYVFREYLENRFGLSALEETTSEITAQLASTNINIEQQNVLKEILETADMVKFAKATPPVEVHGRALEHISLFVQKTKLELVAEETENKETGE